MKIVTAFPHPIRDIENVWIPLADGCRLAARLWLPADAGHRPVPAILEYIPYRKRDFTRPRDEPMHRYFAGHGYAAVRVDLRGAGDSDGLLRDEYLQQELDDGVEVIRWIAAQPWCSGRVGMLGKSWGGINALQIAALAPPPLKAVITVCSTDDRYADDAHYMGGCLLNENLIWGSVLMLYAALPPDPELVGGGWRDAWRARLAHLELFPQRWLRHPLRDGYWKHGSVGENLSRIRCPVYALGGWADGYSNAVPRLLAGLGNCKGLVGPWAHLYPHDGIPGPAIGFLQEALRWWDHWLKGIDTGIMAGPRYRVWMQEAVQPRAFLHQRPGRWVAEARWPSSRTALQRL
ncbi:MAG: CocE/NonD family hydrolase, partial [Pseudomonadota bacterium]|nr:CocE/NonD family hydrolase [Pseudomonadota bacterium]